MPTTRCIAIRARLQHLSPLGLLDVVCYVCDEESAPDARLIIRDGDNLFGGVPIRVEELSRSPWRVLADRCHNVPGVRALLCQWLTRRTREQMRVWRIRSFRLWQRPAGALRLVPVDCA